MRFLDVKTDYAFKKVFGSAESVPILISFLNALIGFPKGREVVDLVIVDPYQIPMLKGMKDTYVDVKARLADGRQVIIEMQVLNVEGFEQRILYNAAKSYSRQLAEGEDYTLLNPVIALTLTEFVMFEGGPELSRFILLEKDRFIQYRDDIELIFIELPKFTKGEEALADLKDKWLYFVKNAGRLSLVPKALAGDTQIQAAFAIANTAGLSEEELDKQERRHDFIRLQRGWQKKAYRDGREEGLAEGREEGREEGRVEGGQAKALAVACHLLPLLDDAAIAAATGLNREAVAKLRRET